MSDEAYPTVWAYEQACAALATCKAELAKAEAEAARLQAIVDSVRSKTALDVVSEKLAAVSDARRLRNALEQARYFVSKHDGEGHVLASVDAALWPERNVLLLDPASEDRS